MLDIYRPHIKQISHNKCMAKRQLGSLYEAPCGYMSVDTILGLE